MAGANTGFGSREFLGFGYGCDDGRVRLMRSGEIVSGGEGGNSGVGVEI